MKKTIHANALRLRDKGVLITGDSCSGKSTLTLALLERARVGGYGHALIGDDYIELARKDGKCILQALPNMAGAIEVRGAGIFKIDFEPEIPLDLCVFLTDEPQRLPAKLGDDLVDKAIKKLFLPTLQNSSILNLCYAIEFTLFAQAWQPASP